MTRILLENVSVDFPIYGTQQLSLRSAIAQRATGGLIQRDSQQKDRVIVRALTDVSLRLEEGDRLGLVGHNGSGKSTLLKVLAGIYEPVAGKVTVTGRVTPLFDMMPGLDVEDTGYENVLTAGMLLGMSREYVESKIPEIEEVSELGDFLSLPVRTYSMGMTTRLGFALVTALDPDVLIMDEGFGAADLRFTERAAERMEEFIGRSRVMVLASHSDTMLQSICNKAALMKEGRLVSVGSVEQILDEYHFMVYGKQLHEVVVPEVVEEPVEAEEPEEPIEPPEPPPVYSAASIADVGIKNRLARTSGAARFTRAVLTNEAGHHQTTFSQGEPFRLHLDYEVLSDVPSLYLLVRLMGKGDDTDHGIIVSGLWEPISDRSITTHGPRQIEIAFEGLPFEGGRFNFYIGLGREDDQLYYDVIDENVALPSLTIESPARGARRIGMARVEYHIEHIDRRVDAEQATC